MFTRRKFILGSAATCIGGLLPLGKTAIGKIAKHNHKAFDPFKMYQLCSDPSVQHIDVELKNGVKHRCIKSFGIFFKKDINARDWDCTKPELIDSLAFNRVGSCTFFTPKLDDIKSIKIFRSPSSWEVIHPGW